MIQQADQTHASIVDAMRNMDIYCHISYLRAVEIKGNLINSIMNDFHVGRDTAEVVFTLFFVDRIG